MSEPTLPPPVPSPSRTAPPVPDGPLILPYAQAQLPRPGLLTAVGVLSLVFGGIGALASASGILQSIIYIVLPRIFPQQVATATTGPSAPVANPFANIPAAPMVANGLAEAVLLGLAIYLLVCGIWVLRDRASSRRHLQRYAKLKIVAATLGAAASAWSTYAMQSAILASMPSSSDPTSAAWFVPFTALIAAMFGLAVAIAYPVAVLIVMHLRSIKQYYGTLGAS